MEKKKIKELKKKIKLLSEDLDKNYWELLDIYKTLITEYYLLKKTDENL
jgi:hypothetical protein